MRVVQWDETLSVGNAEIDKDHQALFELLDQLRTAVREGQTEKVRLGILSELVRRTQAHFALEESVMTRIAYAEAQAHRAEHGKLMAQVRELQDKVAQGDLSLSLSVFQFLYGWLARHIEVKDRPLGQASRMHSEP
jgi:hemerythrin-like metal-binding protein